MVERSLNIKNPRTYELARKLATLTGLSMTQAVTKAIEESIERKVPAKLDIENVLSQARKMRHGLYEGCTDEDPSAFLYDENGLPN